MTFEEAKRLYFKSPRWLNLRASSRAMYAKGFDRLGHLSDMDIKAIVRPDIVKIMDKYYDTPGVGHIVHVCLMNVFAYCVDRGLINYNPAKGRFDRRAVRPFIRWSDAEIEKFLAEGPEYLRPAVLVAFYTGQRRSDIIRMRWTDYNGDIILIRQQKTGRHLRIPVHPRLKEYLDQHKRNTGFILLNAHGQKWVGDSIKKAIYRANAKLGISGKSIHGVRKSTASRLAEIGATPHQIAAITGHRSLKEVSTYTEDARQEELARSIVDRWV